MGCLFFVFAVWARDPASCTQSGFEEGLSCQTCERLFQLTTNEELHNQCLACCQEEGEERVTQAERVVLVWSEWNQRSFPHIQIRGSLRVPIPRLLPSLFSLCPAHVGIVGCPGQI